MFTRIYRVQIKPALRAEFEPLFQTIARASVEDAPGCVQVVLGLATPQAPDEYAMISIWESRDAMEAFAGPDWSVPHIPEGMERFIVDCWLHHYATR